MTEEEGKLVAEVTHFYDKISVAILKIADGCELKVGDKVHFRGNETDLEESIESMQLFKEPIEVAKAGQEIGIKVSQKLKEGDKAYIL